MAGSTFIYVTYIRSSPDKLWKALTSPEFIRQYWFGMHCESDWQTGSSWRLTGKFSCITSAFTLSVVGGLLCAIACESAAM